MRADRLVAIVLLLQSRGRMTAGELADILETSERTVRRDLDALCIAGVPLYSQRGKGGGWTLLGGHRIDLSGFTVDEARALFLMAGSKGSPGVRSAMRKIMAALPEPLRQTAAAAGEVAHVDPARWGRDPDEPPGLAALEDAVLARVQVDIDYAKPGSAPERRRVHPYGLVSKAGVWYLLAGTPAGRRTFRVSRVLGVEPTMDAVTVPDGFDLAGAWDDAQRDFVARMAVVDVEVEVSEAAVLRVSASARGWTSSDELGAPRPGWRRFRVSFPHARAAAVTLAPFGGDVVVLRPDEVRDELVRIGRGLVEAHDPGRPASGSPDLGSDAPGASAGSAPGLGDQRTTGAQ